MKINYRLISIVVLTLLLVLVLVPTASAYESRGGDIVTVKADEVIDDDLYVSAETFVLDGTIKGDLFVVGRHVVINGVLEGDLMGAAQDITINGDVKDDARVVGAVIILTEKAKVGGDVMFMGYSIEAKSGSQIKGALLGGSGQAFFGGEIAKDLKYSASGIDIEGKVGGNVEVEVGSPDDVAPDMPMQFFKDLPPVPSVKRGLSIGEEAIVGGNITYTSPKAANIPADVVKGQTVHLLPKLETDTPSKETASTPQSQAVSWALDSLRLLITVLIIGLLLVWLLPASLQQSMDTLASKPLPSLGYGVLGYLLFWVAVLVAVLLLILVTILFGALTLGGLSAGVLFTGLGGITIIVTLFLLITAYVTKVIVSFWAGRWIMTKIKPDSADNPYAALIVGVIILVLLVSIPLLGGLLKIAVTCLGLGAIVLIGKSMIKKERDSKMMPIA